MAENKPNQSNVPKNKLTREQKLNLRNSKKLFPKELAERAVKRHANNNEKRKSKTNPRKNQVRKRNDLKKGTTNEHVDFAKKGDSNKTDNKSEIEQSLMKEYLSAEYQKIASKRTERKKMLKERMEKTMPTIPEGNVLSDTDLQMSVEKGNKPKKSEKPNKSKTRDKKENKEGTGVAQSNDSGITPKKNHFLSKIADLAKPSTRTMTSKGYNSLNNDEKKETKKKVQKKSGRKSYHKL